MVGTDHRAGDACDRHRCNPHPDADPGLGQKVRAVAGDRSPARNTLRRDGEFCWLDLKTRRPRVTSEFLANAFGWDFRVDENSWRTLTFITADGHDLGGFSDLSAPVYPVDAPDHIALYLAVSDIAATVAAAVEASAQLLVPAFDAGDTGQIATLIDPYGCAVSLWERSGQHGWTHPPSLPRSPARFRHLSDSPADTPVHEIGAGVQQTERDGVIDPWTHSEHAVITPNGLRIFI